MKLVVAGDRLDPPVGVLTEVYNVMLACWNTESLKRPRFYDLVEFFLQLLKREDLMSEPLPPIRHRLTLTTSAAGEGRSSTTPSTQDSCQLGETLDFDASIATTPDNNNPSQVTVSTLLGSTTSSRAATAATSGSHSSSTYDSMPTTGSGVCRAVFPPYEPRIADPLIKTGPTPMLLHRDSSFTAGSCSSSSSGSNRGGSQDEDSTPHASAASSIKYKINPRSAIMANSRQQSVAPPVPIRPPKPPVLPDDAVCLTRSEHARASLPPRPTHHSQSDSTNSPDIPTLETPSSHHPSMKVGDSVDRSLPPIDGSSTSTVDDDVEQQQPARRGQRRCQSSQIV